MWLYSGYPDIHQSLRLWSIEMFRLQTKDLMNKIQKNYSLV